jgi:hypothetical protein
MADEFAAIAEIYGAAISMTFEALTEGSAGKRLGKRGIYEEAADKESEEAADKESSEDSGEGACRRAMQITAAW